MSSERTSGHPEHPERASGHPERTSGHAEHPERAAVAPGRRPLALALVYLFRLAAGSVVATPLIAAVAGSGVAHLPTGDAALFEPGGERLLQVLHQAAAGLAQAAKESAWLTLLMSALGVYVHGVWLFCLGHRGRLSIPEALARAARALPRLFGSSALGLIGLAIVIALCASFDRALSSYLELRVDEQQADLLRLLIACLWLVPLFGLGLLQALTRAAIVQRDLGLVQALCVAAGRLKRHLGALSVARAGLLVWSLVTVLVAALAVGELRLEQPSALRVAACWGLHQAAVLLLLLLQGAWLRVTLEVTAAPSPRR